VILLLNHITKLVYNWKSNFTILEVVLPILQQCVYFTKVARRSNIRTLFVLFYVTHCYFAILILILPDDAIKSLFIYSKQWCLQNEEDNNIDAPSNPPLRIKQEAWHSSAPSPLRQNFRQRPLKNNVISWMQMNVKGI